VIGPLAGRPVTQLGFVVRDLEAAMAELGGEWLHLQARPDVYADVTYHRGETLLDHAVALRTGTSPQIELIAPGGSPNVWQEWLDAGREGIHHVAVEIDEPLGAAAAMAAAGFPVVQSGRFGGDGEFAYFDTVAACGVYVEALRFPSRWRP
jgi:hypothetical protein